MKNRSGKSNKLIVAQPDYLTGNFRELPDPLLFMRNQNLYREWLLPLSENE